jgi:hypothetical protein
MATDPAQDDFALEVTAAASRRRASLSDDQIAELVAFIRSAAGRFDRHDAAKALGTPSVSAGVIYGVLEELSLGGHLSVDDNDEFAWSGRVE